MEKHYIACDLGAESGRVILGTLRDGRLTLEEIHRFANGATKIQNSLRWNIIRIFDELKQGLRMVAARGVAASGMSVDSWGVDYVLFNDRQPMLGLSYQYRDARTERTYAAALENPGRDVIFAETGIQFMAINTLYHLIADVNENSDLLQIADQFLNIADYMNYLFCGVGRAEVSLSSTTQLYNPTTGQWSAELIQRFELPEEIFPPIVASGTRLGPLLTELCDETGLSPVEVIATCSHDTGAAVAAVPAEGDDWAYLSSGTWSLIGVELPEPRINNDVLAENFTNEAGLNGTTRFLKNIVGLWLLQESRRSWSRQGQTLDYTEINQLAEQAEPFRSLINPDDPRFMSPADMPTAIDSYCQETNQPVPETPGQYARCILESLALLYGRTLDTVQRLTGRQILKLHIVGGGSQSTLLNQLAANATGRTVYAGPVEATAIGNVLIQAMAMGDLESLSELRGVVRDSFSIATYEPESSELWEQTRQRFAEMVRGGK
ncbi:rhamnulokinase family protein [Novipirellula rosea]|uniref:Rhamnulokinase family protein n=1 Tax=Novipirellula rosea TaxID=1031540 RepID=A0ABP8MZP3_9BACT